MKTKKDQDGIIHDSLTRIIVHVPPGQRMGYQYRADRIFTTRNYKTFIEHSLKKGCSVEVFEGEIDWKPTNVLFS